MPTQTQLPKSWPADSGVQYITKPTYSKKLDKETLTNLHDNPTSRILSSPKTPYSNVRITPITNPTHPAFQQNGLFTAISHTTNSFILFYLGYVHPSSETDETSNYDLSMDRELGIGVDAASMGNEARFINDYRGVAGQPNAEFRDCWVNENGKIERRVGVFVHAGCKKGLKKGEEILVSYGKGFWRERQAENENEED